MFKLKVILLVCLMPYLLSARGKNLTSKEKAGDFLGSRPVRFLENNGQMTDAANRPVPFVLFKAYLPGLDVYVTEKGLTYIFSKKTKTDKDLTATPIAGNPFQDPGLSYTWERVDVDLSKADIRRENIVKENPEPGSYNYYYAHCPDGIRNVKQYARLTIKNIYPGIDWMLYNSGKTGFKYDFIVHPGADASQIQFAYSSLQPLKLEENGSLELKSGTGSLTENAPYTYVKETGEAVTSNFVILFSQKKEDHYENLVGFNLAAHLNNSQTLVIDPQLVWSTTFGGSFNDAIKSIDHDLYDNIFVTGLTQSTNFPVKNSGTYFQGTGIVPTAGSKAFIAKFNAQGVLIWSTYYGGSGSEVGFSVVVDSLANIFVGGQTTSADFPLQNAGTFFQGTYGGAGDGFILKFDNMGNRLFATYYGGSALESIISVYTDKKGNVFAAGITYSQNFPLQNAGTYYDNTPPGQGHSNGFIVKLDNSCNRLWATYFKCNRIQAIHADDNGFVYVTGFTYQNIVPTLNPGGGAYFQAPGGDTEAFIAKFDNLGTLLWSTYYGGKDEDYGKSVISDKTGNVFVCGITRSKDLPVIGDGAYLDSISSNSPVEVDAFLAKFGPAGNLVWATYCGGPGYEEMGTFQNLAIDACNAVYLSFESSAGAVTLNACEGGYLDPSNGNWDQYIMRFSGTGVLQWSSYFGGSGAEAGSSLDIDNRGELYMVGHWDSQTSGAGTYTFVNPGGGAFFDNTINSTAGKGSISRFTGRMIGEPAAYSYSTICIGSTTSLSPVLTNSFVNGGMFSASQGLAVNPSNGNICVAGMVAGTYTVFYHYEACECHASQLVLNVSTCTGLTDHLQTNDGLKIYGNPNMGEFTVKGSRASALMLVNELGQVVRTVSLSATQDYQATVTGLSPGIYFLKAENIQSNHKIVVLR